MAGFCLNEVIPFTGDSKVKKEDKEELEKIYKKKILVTEKFGNTTPLTLKSNMTKKKCNRRGCIICHHGGDMNQCYKSNVG